jgi:DGQHR domain-containing protein
MSTTFTGAFAPSIGGFLTVRGYARLTDIAKCSVADEGYQRDLQPKHVEEIRAFFSEGEYLFFPEIVLSVQLDADFSATGAPSDDPLALISRGQPFKSNTNGLDVKPRKAKSASDLTRYEITVPDGVKLFKRIDGNHRLNAFEELKDEKFDRYEAPFCVIFLPAKEARRSEKALFHNINSKAWPLTSEEAYKGIVDDETDFPDDALRDRFGQEFLACRHLRTRLDFGYLSNLKAVFGKNEGQKDRTRSVLIQSLRDAQAQLAADTVPEADDVFEAIKQINTTYADARLQASTAQGLFAAFLFFHLNTDRSKGTFEQFTTWVLQTHQYELQNIHAADLIKIFGKIAQSKKRQVFVSMQFSEDTKPNFDAIKNAVDDLNAMHSLNIELRPIRIDQFDTGFSYEINAEILRLIEDSGYLIADLTRGNKNVYHEIGYLMGLNQGKGLKHENFLLIHNGTIGDVKADIGFNVLGIKQIRKDDTLSLRDAVRDQLSKFYELG